MINGFFVFLMFYLRFGYFGTIIEEVFRRKEEIKRQQEQEINESLIIPEQSIEDKKEEIVLTTSVEKEFLHYFTIVNNVKAINKTVLGYGPDFGKFLRASKNNKFFIIGGVYGVSLIFLYLILIMISGRE